MVMCGCGGYREGFRSRGAEYETMEKNAAAHEVYEQQYAEQKVVVVEQQRPAQAETIVTQTDTAVYQDKVFTPRTEAGYTVEKTTETREVWQDNITPEVYSIVATRATNKMLDETSKIYDNAPSPTLYVKEVKRLNDELPAGLYLANKVTKDIINGSRTFSVVNNIKDAEYVLDVTVDKLTIEGYNNPVIKYHSVLSDNKNNKIQEWSESIQQVINDDKSWW